MNDTNYYDHVQEYINGRLAEAEQQRLAQIAKAAQPEPDSIGFIRSYLSLLAGKLKHTRPEAQPQQPEFKQKPVSSVR